jgi:hypothetical protein
MKVLIGCEYSGRVRDAFIRRGHNAISCDLLQTESPGPHFKGDIYEMLNERWDLIIMHPPCTALTVAGNHVYSSGKPRHSERLNAAFWTEQLWFKCLEVCEKVCFENPVGVLGKFTKLPRAQYVQPYDFGENASKKTGLILHGLELIYKTIRFPGRRVEYNGRMVERWDNQTDSGQNKLAPSEDRWKLRSTTYPGIASAMAMTWG